MSDPTVVHGGFPNVMWTLLLAYVVPSCIVVVALAWTTRVVSYFLGRGRCKLCASDNRQ